MTLPKPFPSCIPRPRGYAATVTATRSQTQTSTADTPGSRCHKFPPGAVGVYILPGRRGQMARICEKRLEGVWLASQISLSREML